MTEIADGMFFQCEDLIAINFAENGKLARIGSYAFGAANTSSAYPKITSIEIPGSVTEIAGGAFNNWQNLTSVTFEEGTQPLVFGDGNGYSNFSVSRNYTNYGVFGYCTALTSVTLPARLTTVGRFTFTGCSSLKTIDFEKNADGQYGVTEIDYGAFRETAIESFVVPDTVTTLAYNSTYTNNTFARCLSLKSVTLPVGFTAANDCEINWRMFYGSSALEAVNVRRATPTTIRSTELCSTGMMSWSTSRSERMSARRTPFPTARRPSARIRSITTTVRVRAPHTPFPTMRAFPDYHSGECVLCRRFGPSGAGA